MSGESTYAEPGGRERAPGRLAVVQAFVNTNDVEAAHDELATPEALGSWLADHGLVPPGARVSEREHARALDVREGLRELGSANNGLEPDRGRLVGLDAATAALPLAANLVGSPSLRPLGTGVDAALGAILATVVAAIDDGTWPRLKACRCDDCRWVFYDHSRNRSGNWCTMAVCGSREKARAYRRRVASRH